MLLERALAWARVLPPYTRVWLEDDLFHRLYEDLVLQAGFALMPEWEPWHFHLRTVTFCRKSAKRDS